MSNKCLIQETHGKINYIPKTKDTMQKYVLSWVSSQLHNVIKQCDDMGVKSLNAKKKKKGRECSKALNS